MLVYRQTVQRFGLPCGEQEIAFFGGSLSFWKERRALVLSSAKRFK
jgi:hypothetical protein